MSGELGVDLDAFTLEGLQNVREAIVKEERLRLAGGLRPMHDRSLHRDPAFDQLDKNLRGVESSQADSLKHCPQCGYLFGHSHGCTLERGEGVVNVIEGDEDRPDAAVQRRLEQVLAVLEEQRAFLHLAAMKTLEAPRPKHAQRVPYRAVGWLSKATVKLNDARDAIGRALEDLEAVA